MKKILFFCFSLIFIVFLGISIVFANNADLNFEDSQKMLKEVMLAYYNRRTAIQYNFAKATYGEQSPEEATSQETKYSVCGAFVNDVYSEAFGIKYNNNAYNDGYTADNLFDSFPKYNNQSIEAARVYYDLNKNNQNSLDGNFLIYYQKKKTIQEGESDGIKYIYGINNVYNENETTLSSIASKLQTGDIVVYTDHVMLVYDVIKDGQQNIIDALLINATSGPFNHNVSENDSNVNSLIYSKLTGTNKLIYNIYGNQDGNPFWKINGVPIWGEDIAPSMRDSYKIVNDENSEGAIQWVKLSDVNELVNSENKYFRCTEDECAIIRPFYNRNNKAVFNYKTENSKINKSKLRTKYPGLIIEKTVDKGDNNAVYEGDQLLYTLQIKNTSNTTYSNFAIKETLNNFIIGINENNEYVSSFLWENLTLAPGEIKTLTYKGIIKVNSGNSSNYAESEGKFYTYVSGSIDENVFISTGVIKNEILRSTSVDQQKKFQDCINDNASISGYNGLEYIDAIYNCVYNENFDFKNFDFENIFVKRENPPGKSAIRVIDIRTDNEIKNKLTNETEKLNSTLQYKKMILNNYWNGLTSYTSNNKEILMLPAWIGGGSFSGENKTALRAKTIRSEDFKDGDILIYKNINDSITKENGIYSFIYMGGKFIGKNYESEDRERNEFDYGYYTSTSGLSIYKNLYSANQTIYKKVNNKIHQSILNFANYQTLYDKDYYVILRPEKVMKSIRIESDTQTTVPTFIQGEDYSNLNEISSKFKDFQIIQFYGDNSIERFNLSDAIENGSAQFEIITSDVGEKIIPVKFDNQTTELKINIVPNKYKIKYISDGKELDIQKEVTYKEEYGKLEIPTKEGYNFVGWYLEETYETQVTEKSIVEKSETHSLYAKWEKMFIKVIDYILNEELNYITNIKEKTKVKVYKTKFELSLDYQLKVYDKNNNELDEEDFIFTGSIIKIIKGNGETYEYVNIVKGDVNGDGIVNIADVIKIADHTLNNNILDLYEKEAAEVTNDTVLNIADVLKIADYTLDKTLEICK